MSTTRPEGDGADYWRTVEQVPDLSATPAREDAPPARHAKPRWAQAGLGRGWAVALVLVGLIFYLPAVALGGAWILGMVAGLFVAAGYIYAEEIAALTGLARGWVGAALISVMVIVGITALPEATGPPDPKRACLGVARRANEYVKHQLKAPSTARFSPEPVVGLAEDGQTCVVRSWVDAQNSFGATIRTHFVVSMTRKEGSDWRLVDLQFP